MGENFIINYIFDWFVPYVMELSDSSISELENSISFFISYMPPISADTYLPINYVSEIIVLLDWGT